MPCKPKRPCAYPGCGALVTDGPHCEKHRGADDRRRGTAAQRGYGSKWQRYRLRFLRRQPLCVRCQAEGRVTAAQVVDHVQPHKGDPVLFWSVTNHQALCKSCHDRKTAREDGAFGRPAADPKTTNLGGEGRVRSRGGRRA